MVDVLTSLLDIVVLVFAVASMLSAGLTYTVQQIVGPLRNLRLVVLALVANFVLVPLWAVLIARLLSLDEPYEIGLVLVASAAGAPFLIKLVAAADGDVAFAASLLVLLLPATVVYMPIVVPLIAPDADVGAGAIARPLVTSMLLPLAIGLVVKAVSSDLAERIRPILGPISTAALALLVVLTVVVNFDEIVDVFGQGVIFASLLFIVGAFAIGFALGGAANERDELGLATAQRNIAAATVVATQGINDPDTTVTVIVTSTVSMLILFPLASQLKKYFGQSVQAERKVKRSGAT